MSRALLLLNFCCVCHRWDTLMVWHGCAVMDSWLVTWEPVREVDGVEGGGEVMMWQSVWVVVVFIVSRFPVTYFVD